MIPGIVAGGPAQSGPPTDPYWANVSALLHMDGTPGDNTFIDETGKTWTPSGNFEISATEALFAESGYGDGSGGWIDGPSSADFTFGTGDFTLELGAYIIDNPVNRALLSLGSNWTLYMGSGVGNLYVFDGVSTNILNGGAQSLNQFDRLAVTRASGTLRLFRNGVVVSSTTYTDDMTSSNMRIGASTTGAGSINGYIDEVRITKGVARYTANYTPAGFPFPNS